MIKEKLRAANAKSETLCFPGEPSLSANLDNFNPPHIGTATVKRKEHAVADKEELRSRVPRKDDPVLLSVIEK